MGGGISNRSLFDYHLKPCHYCDRTMYYSRPKSLTKAEAKLLKPSRDHVIPRSRAKGIPSNIVICCTWCNQMKGDLPYADFVLWIKINFGREIDARSMD